MRFPVVSLLLSTLLSVTVQAAYSASTAALAAERSMLAAEAEAEKKKHHHKKKGHHSHSRHHKRVQEHHPHVDKVNASHETHVNASTARESTLKVSTPAPHNSSNISLLANKAKLGGKVNLTIPMESGSLQVNAPLPASFTEMFQNSVAEATGVDPSEIKVVMTREVEGGLAEIRFEAPPKVVEGVLDQAGNPESKLATGKLCPFLVERDAQGEVGDQCDVQEEKAEEKAPVAVEEPEKEAETEETEGAAPKKRVEKVGGYTRIDIDTQMPYGNLEPFGREDTAQELTESSIQESNAMVDQLERAEVAEEKRAVFRALTRLRGAAITSFDGIARAQTSNIDQYNKANQWRAAHPLRHLANEEADISKWAFPDGANL